MIEKVIRAIEKYDMLRYTDRVTVALSGGADSVCLLYALCELGEKYGVTLDAIHINHQLRGNESHRDEEFVRSLCEKLGIPLKVFRINVSEEAERSGESIELVARNMRYELFYRENRGVVATAHTADDNLETVLFNMTRGAGLNGLCGIPPKRDYLIRPLLFCTRKEVEAYLSERNAPYIIDSTNLTDDYTRNFLRHNTVPTLKRLNPSVEQTVSVMSENLREDNDFLLSTAEKIYGICVREDKLDATLLAIQHPAVIKRVIARYLQENFAITVDALHLENCKRLLETGGRTQLKGELFAFSDGGFFFAKREQERGDIRFSVSQKEISLQNTQKINNLLLKNAIDCAKINGSLTIRCRLPSDEIRLRGRNCTKSLKKLFNERKIPLELRDTLPVASDEDGVVWIHGIGVSERVAVDEKTKNAILFEAKEINKTLDSGDVKYDKQQ